MLGYNRIAYELDGLRLAPDDVQGISLLQHFDDNEIFSYNGSTALSAMAKFGKGCVYFPDNESNITVTNITGMFNLNPFGNYEFEVFVKLNDTTSETEANIFGIADLTLTERPKTIAYYYETQGYKFFGGHTFKYFETGKTWTAAKAACEELGGHLATSTSEEKNTFLYTAVTMTNGSWLGGTDEAEEGTWTWVTGEDWSYTNWQSGEPNNTGGSENYIQIVPTSGVWNDVPGTTTLGYICEWDYDMRETQSLSDVDPEGINKKILNLSCLAWNMSSINEVQMLFDIWYHVLLRISGEAVSVFIDGVEVIKAHINNTTTLIPEKVQLGGYVGYMDEFAFRRNAGTEAPIVPTAAYETGTTQTTPTQTQGLSNAPVSRVAWSCDNLPDGLTLSSAGVLSGKPTTAGTYECEVSVTTNWGTTTKTIKVIIE